MDWDEFERLAYSYRSAPRDRPEEATEKYKELKEFVRQALYDEYFEGVADGQEMDC